KVRHVELLALTPSRIMIVLITTNGRVEQRVVDCPGPVSESLLGDLRSRLNATVTTVPLSDAPEALAELSLAFVAADRPPVAAIVSTLLETLAERREERVALGGTANLTRFSSDFPGMVVPVLEALEEQVVLLRLLGEASDPTELTVRIGHENQGAEFSAASVVSVGYGEGDTALAKLGILGPTRMDYPSTMGAVRAVARYVGRILAEA
ncbi:MAG TPA: HrcA family transcriptional regulator, partial [Candidatus Limnocylindria bacterium]|nr:HrcA family transcriptional regulator [Candidatus Limnocylindria bacterium]